MNIQLLHNNYFKLNKSEHFYASVIPRFALAQRTGNTVKAASRFASCRETLVAFLRRKVVYGVTDTKTLSLLIWFSIPNSIMILKNNKSVCISEKTKKNYFEYVAIKHKESIYRAVHVLNIIEKELKWKKTTVKEPKHRFSNKHSLYLFTLSPKWMFSPALFSLYTLIIRTGTFTTVSRVRTINGLAAAYIKTDKTHFSIGQQSLDAVFLKDIAPYLKKFLTRINKIYKGRDQKTNFDRSILLKNYSPFYEGITKLIKGTTGDSYILERFLKYTS